MIRIAFVIFGDLPPRKSGAGSMWGLQSQAGRIIRLRQAARTAFGEQEPFHGPVIMVLTVMLRTPSFRPRTGDLDAYIAGTFDALMGATSTTRLSPLWAEQAHEDDPHQPIAFRDDSQVIHVVAEKRAGAVDRPWYEIIVEAAEN
jgi:hypothetical protein